MVIRTSSGNQVTSLIADLSSENLVKREAAIARLAVIGGRAVERLIGASTNAAASSTARIAGFRALEAIGDQRAIEPALRLLDDSDTDVALAALATARAFVEGPRGVEIVDRLTALVLDTRRSPVVRLAGFHALGHLDASMLEPLQRALEDGTDRSIAAAAKITPRSSDSSAWLKAPDGKLPDDPITVCRAVAERAGTLPLASLHRLIERIREREQPEEGSRKMQWMMARASAHLALAKRKSRLAVYDLRETFETAQGPVPVEFLAAVSSIGDASCLKPLAAAYARARARKPQLSRNDWWPRHIGEAFRTIVARENVTKRSAEIKKIEKQWPEALADLWAGGAGKTSGASR